MPLTNRRRYFRECVAVHKAALTGDTECDQRLLNTAVTAPVITLGGETALHVSAVARRAEFVTRLLNEMPDSGITIQNEKGSTALCFAAAAGDLAIAQQMVNKCPRLPTICGPNGLSPLYMAALQAHAHVAHYLFPRSGFLSWSQQNQILLLNTSIQSGLYALATEIVEMKRDLVVARDENGDTPLQVLARIPFTVSCNGRRQFFRGITHKVLRSMKLKSSPIAMPTPHPHELLNRLWDGFINHQHDIESGELFDDNTLNVIFIAAECGNYEMIVELINKCPDFLYKVNNNGHSIFHIAVLHRYVNIFNLLYELGGFADLMLTYIDEEGNNVLHLAAKIAPQSQLVQIPGAALQMQREVLWYREVEKIVHPSFRNMKNKEGKTPHELFLQEHETLMKEGEKLLKQTAKSCMLVTILIATVVFTAAFTVPGGYNNNTGVPILENKKLFAIFPISEAVATLSSLSSMLMFLSIMTSGYGENEFLTTLPFMLVIGVMLLFVSIGAMMMAFCSALLVYKHVGLSALFASVPVMFIMLKYRLLVTVLQSTCGCKWLFCSNNRLFN